MASVWYTSRRQTPREFEFHCRTCGEIHRGSPSFAYAKPAQIFDIPEHERGKRVVLSTDTCIVDHETFLIRAILEVPIVGVDQPFMWGVWVSQSQANFERYVTTFEQDQLGEVSFGWLAVALPGYDRPNESGWPSLACNVHWGPRDQRPAIELQVCDHQLYYDQINGIDWPRAVELARLALHGE